MSWVGKTFRSVIDTLIFIQFRSHAPGMLHVELLFRRGFIERYSIDVGGEGEDVGEGDGVEGEILGEEGGHCLEILFMEVLEMCTGVAVRKGWQSFWEQRGRGLGFDMGWGGSIK